MDARGSDKGPNVTVTEMNADDIRRAIREGIRDPESEYPREMEGYEANELTDEEMEQLVDLVLGLD